jgi:hypothetical protein
VPVLDAPKGSEGHVARSRSKVRRLDLVLRLARAHGIPILILFGLAFMYRIKDLYTPLYGDQSLYYYLSRTLGFAPKPLVDLEPLWTHVVVRPFMYLFFWPWANLGMTAFRLANIVVGSLTPCLVYALSVQFRVKPALAAVVALAFSVHPIAVMFSAKGFPDNLATALILGGYLAYFANRVAVATVMLLLTVLTKEAFAMFLLPLLIDGAWHYARVRSRLMVAPLTGVAAVVATSGIAILGFGGRLQGWSHGQPGIEFFSAFLASPWFIPLYALLLLQGRIRVLLIGLAAPLFFVVWGFVLHRGVERWYICGPFAVALVALSVALQCGLEYMFGAGASPERSRWEWLRIIAAKACSVALLANIVVLPEQAGWRSELDLVKLAELLEPGPLPSADDAEQTAIHIRKLGANDLLVMDAFWAFAYYPFGMAAKHIGMRYSADTADRAARAELRTALQRHDFVVTGDPDKRIPAALAFREAFESCRVYARGRFVLYEVRASCLRNLER